MKRNQGYMQWLSLFLILGMLIGCKGPNQPLSGRAIDGQIIDEKTQQPLEGAIVIARWSGTVGGMAHSSTVCFHVETATTDTQGRYLTESWSKISEFGNSTDQGYVVTAFKPGYYAKTSLTGDIALPSFTGTREERLEYLKQVVRSSSCHDAEESERNLYVLLENIYKEAKLLAKLPDDQGTLDWIRRIAARTYLALPSDTPSSKSDKMREEFLKDHLK